MIFSAFLEHEPILRFNFVRELFTFFFSFQPGSKDHWVTRNINYILPICQLTRSIDKKFDYPITRKPPFPHLLTIGYLLFFQHDFFPVKLASAAFLFPASSISFEVLYKKGGNLQSIEC